MAARPQRLYPGKRARQHITQAQNNYQRYLRFVETPEDAGWALVVLFYAALHLVQAHAITKHPGETPPKDHQERKVYVANNLGRLQGDFLNLQDGSEQVRYDLWYPTRADVEPYHDQEFENIRKHLITLGISWADEETV